MDFMDISKKRVTVRKFAQTPVEKKRYRKFCSFGYDQKYVSLAEECDDKGHDKINFYYGVPLILFVTYDKIACWTHPQNGRSSGATDATIVATHMMLEAASLDLGSVWISYFDEVKAKELLCLPENWKPVCMLYIGYPAEDFVPNTKLGCHRKPLDETCFFNSVPAEMEK